MKYVCLFFTNLHWFFQLTAKHPCSTYHCPFYIEESIHNLPNLKLYLIMASFNHHEIEEPFNNPTRWKDLNIPFSFSEELLTWKHGVSDEAIKKIVRQQLRIPLSGICDLGSFPGSDLSGGDEEGEEDWDLDGVTSDASTRYYDILVRRIRTSHENYRMHIFLLIIPFYRVASYVATTTFIKERTSCPVPEIVASCTTSRNVLGYEWVLEKELKVTMLASKWNFIAMEDKTEIVKSLARYQSEFLSARNALDGIGNIYFAPNQSNLATPDLTVKPWNETSLQITSRTRGSCDAEFLSRPTHRFMLGPLVEPKLTKDGRRENPRQPQLVFKTLREYFAECSNRRMDSNKVGLKETCHILQSERSTRCEGIMKGIVDEQLENYEDTRVPSALNGIDELHPWNIYVDEHNHISWIASLGYATVMPCWTLYQMPRLFVSERKNTTNPDTSGVYYGDPPGPNAHYWEHKFA